MADFSRELNTDIQVEQFVDGILCIRDKNEKRKAINRIASAERNLKDYRFFSTFKCRDNRDFEYRDDNVRAELRERIVNELFELTRLGNDEEISLGERRCGAEFNSTTRGESILCDGTACFGEIWRVIANCRHLWVLHIGFGLCKAKTTGI